MPSPNAIIITHWTDAYTDEQWAEIRRVLANPGLRLPEVPIYSKEQTMNDAAPQTEMPRYQSKKKVWALEVESVDGYTVTFADKRYAPKTMEPEVFSRMTPSKGDFIVQYDDGYWSVSPRKPFIEGYDRI